MIRASGPSACRAGAAALAALVSLALVAGCGDDHSTPASPSGLQVRVTIPQSVPAAKGATLTVRVQDPATRDDIVAAVTETVGASRVVSVLVADVAEGAPAVVRAVLTDSAPAEVLSGEAAVDAVSWKTPVAITLKPIEFGASPATWTPYGPEPLYNSRNRSNVSGRASAILVDPTNPARVFVGAATGGVWYSANGGVDWRSLSDTLPNSIGSLAFDPSDPTHKTIFVGTGEAVPAGQYGEGIFRVTEDGHWDVVTGSDIFTGKSISRIVPLADGTMFVGVYELAVPGFEDDGNFGVFVRRPGESTFSNSFIPSLEQFGPPDLPITGLLVREVSGGPPKMLAAVDSWSTDDLLYYSGLYSSDDGGHSWVKTDIYDAGGSLLIDRFDVARISLAASPTSPDVVYALVGSYDGTFEGAFVSQDFGNTWVTVTTTPPVPSLVSYEVDGRVRGQSRYNSAIAVDPLDPHTCYVAGTRPARIGNVDFTTGGASGFELGGPGSLQDGDHPHVDHHGLLAVPTTTGGATTTSLYAVTDGGAWMLPNAASGVAATPWTNINGQHTWLQTLQFYSVAVDPDDHTVLYGGAQDNGSSTAEANVYWTQVLGGDGGNACFDPQTRTGYVTYPYSASSLYRIGQVTQDEASGGYVSRLSQSRGLRTGEPAQFIPPFVRSPSDGRLALGTVRVYESTNGGDDWTDISGALADGNTISALGYHPNNSKILYVAAAGAQIYRTTDGQHFDDVSQDNVPELPISAIAVDATDPTGNRAWVAQSAFHTPGTDALGAIFVTVDGGQQWTDFTGGLPDLPVWSLVQCTSVKPNLLFAGTDDGVYSVVLDGTSSWTRFGAGLPTVQVRSLQLAHRAQSGALYLIAGTYGRGVYQIPISGAAASRPPSGPPAEVDAPDIEQEPEEEEGE